MLAGLGVDPIPTADGAHGTSGIELSGIKASRAVLCQRLNVPWSIHEQTVNGLLLVVHLPDHVSLTDILTDRCITLPDRPADVSHRQGGPEQSAVHLLWRQASALHHPNGTLPRFRVLSPLGGQDGRILQHIRELRAAVSAIEGRGVVVKGDKEHHAVILGIAGAAASNLRSACRYVGYALRVCHALI